MIDELREEAIVNKVGGRFKLSTLIQKRLVALNAGARPLVNAQGREQDGNRDPGDFAGQDLPRRPDERAGHGRCDRRRAGSRFPQLLVSVKRWELCMQGREVLIAVTGGIAAYKTAALVSQLVQAGAGVSVIMTRSATKLVAPKTFEALSGRPVVTAVYGRGVASAHRIGPPGGSACVWPPPRPTSWPRPPWAWPTKS